MSEEKLELEAIAEAMVGLFRYYVKNVVEAGDQLVKPEDLINGMLSPAALTFTFCCVQEACKKHGHNDVSSVGKVLFYILTSVFRRPESDAKEMVEVALDNSLIGINEMGEEKHSLLSIAAMHGIDAGREFAPDEARHKDVDIYSLLVLVTA